MRGTVKINVLAGYPDMTRFDMRHDTLHVDMDTFGNQYIQIDALPGFDCPSGGTVKKRTFEGDIDHLAFPLTVVGTQNDHGWKVHTSKAAVFLFGSFIHNHELTLTVTHLKKMQHIRFQV
jgi:hypothetical protein